ncbi:MAG: 50S ribosomal protein L21 [Polyangiaceae bacterium]
MKAAVIRTGGKQYRVTEGDVINVEKIVGDKGAKVEFGEVLLIGGDSVKVGKPTVSGAKVAGEIVGQERGDKCTVFKFKRRKRHRKKAGHRQDLTQVKITGIQG